MPILNPFLRALFQSSALSQALAAHSYVLLVPTTDSLVHAQDRDSGKRYSDLVDDEDFLGSHILRIQPEQDGKDKNIREGRGRAKSYTTVNSRTLIIKDNTIYTNKGFKNLTQAQILGDYLYQSPAQDQQQWLVLQISKPLIGSYEVTKLPAVILGRPLASSDSGPADTASKSAESSKKDIRSFNELLNQFPMIARQMQPGLERLLVQFQKEVDAALVNNVTVLDPSLAAQMNVSQELATMYSGDEEDIMRKALETAVTTAIDLFQAVDKQQLSLLGATTDLTGPAVESLIEQYVAESTHDKVLFPRVCAFHRTADHNLDRSIHHMECIDVSQVGIVIDNGQKGKADLLARVSQGVQRFRRMGVAGSPQQMLDVLLETQKVVSEHQTDPYDEKAVPITINADVLVSLLLLVVIRSQVRHLQARLSYMQRFIFVEDVESGEIGYALSTFEAVLVYLATDTGGLRRASKQNRTLWDAVKTGNLAGIQSILEGTANPSTSVDVESTIPRAIKRAPSRSSTRSCLPVDFVSRDNEFQEANLSHVFPFQAVDAANMLRQRQKKKVKLNTRSLSISSSFSTLSRSGTLESSLSGIEGDVSTTNLAQTQDSLGNSVLMMAVEAQQPASLSYLLSLNEYYSAGQVSEDVTMDGVTLLSAAIQLSNMDTIGVLLSYIKQHQSMVSLETYIAKQDSRGRCAAHYLFNTPNLIAELAYTIPWTLKDKLGQTPLFTMCRAYDHNDYHSIVSEALVAAKNAQFDGQALELENHTDNKGNTLLHILNDPFIIHRVLHHCDTQPNAMNDKKFTPLMLASKYGRFDVVRVFFNDARVDPYLREARGLTAVELAKDDEVRSKIDDLTLFSEHTTQPDAAGRFVSIVRSFFVEDGSTRYIIKVGTAHLDEKTLQPVDDATYTITTSRRSTSDFANLHRWLTSDHPASYIPLFDAATLRPCFQIHSRPSKSVLLAHQFYLDHFLKILLQHPTFGQHEVLWEFLLIPDMQPDQIETQCQLKAAFLREKIAEDYEPLIAVPDLTAVEAVVQHSHQIVRRLTHHTRNVVRRAHIYHQASSDLTEALNLLSASLGPLGPPSTSLPSSYVSAFQSFADLFPVEPPSDPLYRYNLSLSAVLTTLTAVNTSLARPTQLTTQIRQLMKASQRYQSNILAQSQPRKSSTVGLPFSLSLSGSEDSRLRGLEDERQKADSTQRELDQKGRMLRYTQDIVLDELAGWTTWREQEGRKEIRRFAEKTVVREREKLKGMLRVLDRLRRAV